MIKLFIIDDHFLIIEGFFNSFDLNTDVFEIVGSALDIHEALKKLSQIIPDVIILDLFLKQTDPVSNFKKIRFARPSVPIVIYSYENSLEWQLEMFQQGAKAFLDKGEDKESVKNVLCQVVEGKSILPKKISEFLIANLFKSNLEIFSDENKMIFTDLKSGLAIKEIATKHAKSISSIEKYLRKIRIFFKVKSNCELIHLLTKKNYV